MTDVRELEKLAEIEMAKLGVAEELGWGLAAFAALAAYLKWDNWLLAIVVLLGSYFAVTYTYRKRESAASNAYHQAAGIGNYSSRQNPDDAA